MRLIEGVARSHRRECVLTTRAGGLCDRQPARCTTGEKPVFPVASSRLSQRCMPTKVYGKIALARHRTDAVARACGGPNDRGVWTSSRESVSPRSEQ